MGIEAPSDAPASRKLNRGFDESIGENGAGDGNRTHVCALGSSIEPSPLSDLLVKLSHFDASWVKRLRTERNT